MYFLIFQREDMVKLYLNLNECQPIYVHYRYACKKMSELHLSQNITVYFTNIIDQCMNTLIT